MSLTLGPEPVRLVVALVPHSAWWSTLRSSAGAWPNGTAAELRLGDEVWPAVVDGSDLRFAATAEQVDAVIAAGATEASLWYRSDAGTLPWAVGRVSVRD